MNITIQIIHVDNIIVTSDDKEKMENLKQKKKKQAWDIFLGSKRPDQVKKSSSHKRSIS